MTTRRAAWVAALCLCACQREAGVSVQLVAEPAVPALDKLHVMVLQDGELLMESQDDFPLTGLTLPQTVVVSSRGKTDAPVDIVAQGFVGGVVQARGEIPAMLSRDKPYGQVTLVLLHLCPNGVCGVTPTTCDAQGAKCGTLDDLAGGFLNCGGCPAGQACTAQNTCSCAPDCTSAMCGGDDGCGGRCQTGSCENTMSCDAGVCACADLKHDPLNCGACGRACPNAKACANGVCVCNEPSDNVDGHCCPSGFSFEPAVGSAQPYCFTTVPRSPQLIGNAEQVCANLGGCVGFGRAAGVTPAAVPEDAGCGSYLEGVAGQLSLAFVGTYTASQGSLRRIGGGECTLLCDGGFCGCNSCNCMLPAMGCVQPYYCVMDPLGPRQEPCQSVADCPGGDICDAGTCVAAPALGCCVSGDRCGSAKTCLTLDPVHVTGLCR